MTYCYAFASTMPEPWVNERKAHRFMETMSGTPGFYGVHPQYPYIMLVYDTLDHAVYGRSMAEEMGEQVGNNVMNARVDEGSGTLYIDSPAWGRNAPGPQ